MLIIGSSLCFLGLKAVYVPMKQKAVKLLFYLEYSYVSLSLFPLCLSYLGPLQNAVVAYHGFSFWAPRGICFIPFAQSQV